jgi:hypothetical protein
MRGGGHHASIFATLLVGVGSYFLGTFRFLHAKGSGIRCGMLMEAAKGLFT